MRMQFQEVTELERDEDTGEVKDRKVRHRPFFVGEPVDEKLLPEADHDLVTQHMPRLMNWEPCDTRRVCRELRSGTAPAQIDPSPEAHYSCGLELVDSIERLEHHLLLSRNIGRQLGMATLATHWPTALKPIFVSAEGGVHALDVEPQYSSALDMNVVHRLLFLFDFSTLRRVDYVGRLAGFPHSPGTPNSKIAWCCAVGIDNTHDDVGDPENMTTYSIEDPDGRWQLLDAEFHDYGEIERWADEVAQLAPQLVDCVTPANVSEGLRKLCEITAMLERSPNSRFWQRKTPRRQ